MFIGCFIHNLDDKGRIIIPLKFRSLLGEKFVITKGPDKCLWVFTIEEFKNLEKRLEELPLLDPSALRLFRFFSAEAVDATTDAQGRVAIPQHLREYASIEREVVIVGTGNRLEIWNKRKWDELTSSMDEELIREAARSVGIG